MQPPSTRKSDRHDCPATGCPETVPFDQLACRRHWRVLPGRLKRAVNDAWHRGNLDDHARARRDAVDWWASHPTAR